MPSIDAAKNQKEAPLNYGTHFKDADPYSNYHPALKYFFESLPKKASIKLLDAACGNQKRVMDGVARLKKQVDLQAVDIVLPADLISSPPNVSRETQVADLRREWPFSDNEFDGVMFMWSIHWFGLEGSQLALDNLARVLKPNASAVISTLTPYDFLIKDDWFLRANITRPMLRALYPFGRISKPDFDQKPHYEVKNDLGVKEQLMQNGGKYYLKPSHPQSTMGEKTLIGFTPAYLREEFARRDLEVIMEVNKPNRGFPNQYPATLPEGRTHLIYVVRKTPEV